MLAMIPRLANAGTHQTLAILGRRDDLPGDLANLYGHPRITVLRAIAPTLAALPSGLSRLARFVRHEQPDIVQGWLYIGNAVASVITRGTAARCVWGIHASDFKPSDYRAPTRAALAYANRLSRAPDAIVYCAAAARAFHEHTFGWSPSIGHVVANGIDPHTFTAGDGMTFRARHGVPRDAPLLLSVGRAAPQKGFDILARAYRALSSPRPYLVILGPGGDPETRAHFADLMAPATATGDGHAILTGVTADIPGALAAADALVLSSRYGEAAPMVVLEALAAGCPVVATRIGGLPDIAATVGDPAAVTLVPPGDETALGRKLATLAATNGERDIARKLQWHDSITRHFSIDASADGYASVYARLVSGYPSAQV